ncbi:conjugal transfer protein TraK [Zhouia spongiae]|uniref:Conjugal transfer protein TraK n=1 Tax=Zhouia spongiae TaxID=2202721 RepID=A0ABY3YKJ4_9FLAO|nr:conjugal transfer protein TraK [Zhouia spongiae]UNY98329.1 conjugal transfer protein TraK [Zhouia spongiae]
MKTPYMNIYRVLRINRIVVLAVVIMAFVSMIFALTTIYRLNNQMLNSAFMVNTHGKVIPLKLVSQKETLEVEAKAHLDLFHRYFYGLTPANYKNQLKKALWLGDSSVDQLYKQKKADGLYNRLLQYALQQHVREVSSYVDLSAQPYRFQTKVLLEVHRGAVTDHYQLITSGALQPTSRSFPENTHGLLITEFYENQLKKLSDENK